MERINGHDYVDIGGGKRGFRSQNALAGINGTEVTDAFLNNLQEEICAVIEKAGLVLDQNDNEQLFKALQKIATPGFANRLSWMPVLSNTVTAPPAAPAIGDLYVIPAAATGAWAGKSQQLAEWNGTSWNFIPTKDGHGVSMPDGRVFERIGGTYVEKIALDVQSGKWNYAEATGSANALTVSLNPKPNILTVGMVVNVKIATTNTGAASLNAGLGSAPIQTVIGALTGGELPSGLICPMVWIGTAWILVPARGSLIRTTIYSTVGTATFAKLSAAARIEVEGSGGGGAGGGAYSTDSVSASVGSGAFSGACGAALFSAADVPATVTITIGAAGVGVTGGIGGNGGATSFGSLLTLPGGQGGTTLTTPNPRPEGGGTPGTPSGANIWGSAGAPGGIGVAFKNGVSFGGFGGSTRYGPGGGSIAPAGGGAGAPSGGFGAGGGGAMNPPSVSTMQVGGRGETGFLVIKEYA